MLITISAIILMGFAEMYRGAKAGLPRFIEKCILAFLALVALSGLTLIGNIWFLITYLVLFSAACSVSWGAVISASLKKDPPEKFEAHIDAKQDKGDWYLVGPFRKSPMRGLFARSVVWGVLASAAFFAFGFTQAGFIMLAVYSLIMPAAVKFLHLIEGSKFDNAIGKMCLKLVDKDRAWARHEVYRGWLAGITLAVCGVLIL